LTTYIGQTLNSRQEEKPLVSHHIDRAKSEPLHLKNNVTKEMFMKLLHICIDPSNLKSIKCFNDINENELVACFVSYIRKEMGCNYLSKKIIQWYNEIITENRISPSLWTLCCAAPYHAKLTLNEYQLGLGVNTMEGREQKHQSISKYANNTTFQNRWPMIFRHEYIQLIHLRENGLDEVNYRKRGRKYIPDLKENCCLKCGIKLISGSCTICDSIYMKKFENDLRV